MDQYSCKIVLLWDFNTKIAIINSGKIIFNEDILDYLDGFASHPRFLWRNSKKSRLKSDKRRKNEQSIILWIKNKYIKAKLLLLKLVHLFAREVLLLKKLEIEEAKCSTFKTDIIKVGLVFLISNFFITKMSLANNWMRKKALSCSNSALVSISVARF